MNSPIITCAAPTFRTEQFDRFADIRSISQEASTLGLKPGYLPMGRLYPDAADLGIHLQSCKSNETSSWYLSSEDKNGEDIAGWLFRPTVESIAKFPQLDQWTLLIIND
jgi:hypothetical protein